ncbi:ArnT family glycosyltransferase [Prochlorococcus sp. MIT 1307]|uniref:ArnT family glycosyltransferase n=1 Tax=Prochlorococcus sp. MIT 1307 TaxID=3096219 RepID=UPI002A761CE1|nr:glycosyltransferase family 39 protein [Prochlorococcus sp. MIT 1307]
MKSKILDFKRKSDYNLDTISCSLIGKDLDLNFILIIVIVSLVCFWGYWDDSTQNLTAHDEGLYVGRAKLMLQQRDLFTPFTDAHHKTVGSYWLIALSIKLFGFSELSSRLPSGISSILCSITLYTIAKDFLSRHASLITSLTLTSMPLWLQYSRYASPDIPYVLLLLLILLCLIRIDRRETLSIRSYKFYSFSIGLLLSLSIFIRSLMVLLPLMGIIPYYVLNLRHRNLLRKRYLLNGILIGGIPIIIAISLAYHSYGPDSIYSLYGFFQNKAVGGSIYKSIIFYPFNILLLSFPIGLLSIFGIRFLFRKRDGSLFQIFVICPTIIYIILSFMSTRFSHYTLILYPFIAILFGFFIDEIIYNKSSKLTGLKTLIGYLFIALGSLLGIFIILLFTGKADFIPNENILLAYYLIPSSLSYFVVGLFLVYRSYTHSLLINSILTITLIQTVTFTGLYSSGFMGNPNPDIKLFINNPKISNIINKELIYLVNIDGKAKTLFQCYLPNFTHYLNSIDDLSRPSYIIIDNTRLSTYKSKFDFNLINIGSYKKWDLVKITPL